MSKRSKRIKRRKRNPIDGLTPYEHGAWWSHYGIWARKFHGPTYGMWIECPVTKAIYGYTKDEMKFLMVKIGRGMEPKLAIRTSAMIKIPIK